MRTDWDYQAHPGDCCPRVVDGAWTTCCRECAGTAVFPVPWIDSVAEGLRDMGNCSCVRCKGSGRAIVTWSA